MLNDTYTYALNHRDWAPTGGTSLNRARQLQESLYRATFDALAQKVEKIPGLRAIDLDQPLNGRISRLHWENDLIGAYVLHASLAHALRLPEDHMPTIIWTRYSTLDGAGDCSPLHLQMVGDTARDPELIASMFLDAITRHAHRIGVLGQHSEI